MKAESSRSRPLGDLKAQELERRRVGPEHRSAGATREREGMAYGGALFVGKSVVVVGGTSG